jgi:hypothetical protein
MIKIRKVNVRKTQVDLWQGERVQKGRQNKNHEQFFGLRIEKDLDDKVPERCNLHRDF